MSMPAGYPAPPSLAPLGIDALARRLRAVELALQYLGSNQKPQAFALGGLIDTRPLQNPADGDVPTWSKADGLWVPAAP